MKRCICLFLLLFAFVGCSDGDKVEIDRDVEVKVLYMVNPFKQEMPDVGAKAFVYYDRSSIDFFHTTYLKDGVFVKNDETIINPDQVSTVDDNGITVIPPLHYDRTFTIVIESGFYTPRLTHVVYPSVKSPLSVSIVFEG